MAVEDSVGSDGGVESSSVCAGMTGVNVPANGSWSSAVGNGDSDFTRLRGKVVRTYRRRKRGTGSEPKIAQIEKLACKPPSHSEDQHWRSKLQSLSQSFGGDQGGFSVIEGWIKDALCSEPQNGCVKVSVGDGDSLDCQCITQQASIPNKSSSDVEGHSVSPSNGSLPKLNNLTVTKQCQRAVLRLITSEKFSSLCKLSSENFHGFKLDKFLDFSLLSLRMKDGTYEQDPALFSSDVQELWRKLHVVGTEMMSLSKSLSDLSRLFCREMGESFGGSMEHGPSDVVKKELFPWVPDWDGIGGLSNDALMKACTCKRCGGKPVGRDCLVCDSCENMFHLSCITPAITEVPDTNWHCASCTALNIDSHENCAVCQRLDIPAGINEVEDENIPDELESSCCVNENGIQVYKGGKGECCKVCKSTLEHGELFRLCEHHACNHYYHVRCLTNKQLKSHCLRWYCPRCLCRICLTDKDDDKIVLCDACDHAYHIYCMSPPRNSIPEGQWYCRKCEAGLQAIHKAKLAHQSVEASQQKILEKRKGGVCSNFGGKSAKADKKVADDRS